MERGRGKKRGGGEGWVGVVVVERHTVVRVSESFTISRFEKMRCQKRLSEGDGESQQETERVLESLE